MDESYPLGIDFSILRPALACAIWSSPRLLGRRCCSSSGGALLPRLSCEAGRRLGLDGGSRLLSRLART